MNIDRKQGVISFILSERLLTLTVIGSVFTFQFLSASKLFIVDPIFEYLFADDKFNFMSVTLRDGYIMPKPDKRIILDFGSFFREFMKWLLIMILLFLCAKYTRFPDHLEGNEKGVAIL